jgi:hypothetical protein
MMRSLSLSAVAVLLLSQPASAAVVSPAAMARARADGSAGIIVALRPSPPAAAARALPGRRAAIARLRNTVLAGMAPGDVHVDHAYATVAGFAGRATAKGLARLAAHADVLRVDLDPLGGLAEEVGVTHIRADRVQARGVAGDGVTIAVIDTGVEADHPDVVDALIHEECFCRSGRIGTVNRPNCCPGRMARASGAGSAASVDSHGPHVAGIALSRGRVAPTGVAPHAALVAIRVLDDQNRGFVSDWVAALDWIADQRPDVRVINMSLVTTAVYTGECGRGCGSAQGCAANMLLADVIEQLWNRGTLLFAASGNASRSGEMSAPACVAPAVAVGAVDADDAVAPFSNASTELDLLAPGVDIVSDDLDGRRGVMSGTSMASPHAAGTAALLLAARPGLGAPDVVRILQTSGVEVLDARTRRSTPRVDAFAALHEAVRGAELERGGGSRATDCLLEWNFVPPEIVRRLGWALAECRDNDPACDADQVLGRCTFIYSPCFNMRDPLLRACSVAEPLVGFSVSSPRADAPPGSIERLNLGYLASALPELPFSGADTCAAAVPHIVLRPPSAAGRADLRVSVRTATRRDYDHLVLRCLPP